MNGQDEVRAIQKALEPWIRKIVSDATRSCVRRKTVTVATAPNGSTMGVKEPFDDAVMDVPYVSSMSGAQVGDTVTIEWLFGMSNACVVTRESSGGGSQGPPAPRDPRDHRGPKEIPATRGRRDPRATRGQLGPPVPREQQDRKAKPGPTLPLTGLIP